MFWQEDIEDDTPYQVPDDIVDLSFRIDCRTLPLDHAHALSSALLAALPWLEEEPDAGVHLIHGAESGNGWFRPEDVEHELLHLPRRRARMTLRLPKSRLEDARRLEGMTLDIAGHPLGVGSATVRLLSTLSPLFSRYVVTDPEQSEEDFLYGVVEALRALDIPVRKLMAGRSHAFRTPEGVLHTRSVMIADLEPERAVRLQQKGVGPGRKLGCGLFIPHKGISSVKDS
ncbi:type I-MYXAN CRISPR-associated protein Cas6/Cmx6 [Thiohalobacter sp. IOR34]|uniref:type I-MYXAN CRISPR-associated protein Cas6/Cmx6 n=1 Tax=Thiohalobacter sp. IOR34 TaxID=3057176 RepID=UPI0025B0A50A|nr:type I-MYXAN CRISPR-associated protein Cas6/Cmx6 [Thiohalobacter sp. IOR34]WJW74339.1 type I-MYXAN CRISPR-associated protein Cas6/Cmx6 [Thiohalobacter sp. IOR34]